MTTRHRPLLRDGSLVAAAVVALLVVLVALLPVDPTTPDLLHRSGDPVPPHPALRRPPLLAHTCLRFANTMLTPGGAVLPRPRRPTPHTRMGRHAGRGPQLPLPCAATRARPYDRHRHDHRGGHRPGTNTGTALDRRQPWCTDATPYTLALRSWATVEDGAGRCELVVGAGHPAGDDVVAGVGSRWR